MKAPSDISPFLTIAEAAALARVSTKRLRNLMGHALIEGIHFVRPRGLGPRFKREALLAWLDGRDGERVDGRRPSRPRGKLDLSLL